MEDIFDEIAAKDVSKTSNMVKHGSYLFVVRNLTFSKKRKGLKFIAELGVVKAAQTKANVDPSMVGSVIGHFGNFTGPAADIGPVIVKESVCAIFGEDPATIDKAEMASTLRDLFSTENQGEKGTGGKQPCRGFLVAGETTEGGANGERAYLHLTAVDAKLNTAEEVAKRRAEIDKGTALGLDLDDGE